uniref:Uncharacterized protein n=1 Tax=viral metagenome TaxID=1070528 RepID=A0A6C0CKW9_9ZZZZ
MYPPDHPKLVIRKYCGGNSYIYSTSYILKIKVFVINESIVRLLNSFELDKIAEHIASYTNTKIACKLPYSSTYYYV